MRKCSICKQPKLLDDFYKNNHMPLGHSYECKACISKKNKERRRNQPEAAKERDRKMRQRYRDRIRETNRRYLQENPEKSRQWNQQNYQKNYATRLLNGAKSRAKHRGVPFTITKADIGILPTVCPILGIPIFLGKKCACDNSPSLDCIIPKLGYVPGNIAILSHRANTIRCDATVAELRAIADWLEKQTSNLAVSASQF